MSPVGGSMKKIAVLCFSFLFFFSGLSTPLSSGLAKEGLGGININTGCGGVKVQIIDAAGKLHLESVSDEKGFYATGLVLETGVYTIVPSKEDCTFSPKTREATVYPGQYTTVGFSCELKETEVAPPKIIAGPIVQKITQYSCVVVWETDQACDGIVYYSKSAKLFDLIEGDKSLSKTHTIPLSRLQAASVYEYKVSSRGKGGLVVTSRSAFFTTLPEEDNEKPSISFTLPATIKGRHLIVPLVRDNKGIRRVELLVDKKLVATSYSSPFSFNFSSLQIEDGKHEFSMKAYDKVGNMASYNLEGLVGNAVPLFSTTPEVTIVSPSSNQEFNENTRQITVSGSISHPYTRDIKKVEVYIDKVLVFCTSGPLWAKASALPKPYSFTITIEELVPAIHELKVLATDDANLKGSAITNFKSNLPPWKRPSISISYSESTVPYTGTYLMMEVYVVNNGTYPAKNLSIELTQNFLPGFIMTDFNVPADISIVSDKQVATIFKDELKNISGGGTRWTFTFKMVPVMTETVNWSAFDMMNLVRYRYSWEGKTTRSSWNTLDISRDTASTTEWLVRNSDYLLVTNYNRLKSNFPTKLAEINTLLINMADLAFRKKGNICFLSTSTSPADIRSRIHSTWGTKVKSNWSTTGYLLLVGETEIVASFTRSWWWVDDDGVNRAHDVHTTDFPYASTSGSEIKPEISIGRMIGDTVEALILPIKAAVDVQKGTAFFRRNNHANSDAYLISGTGDGETEFWSSTQNNAGVIDNEFHNVTHERSKTLITSSGDMGPYNAVKNHANGLDVLVYRDHAGSSCWCDGVVVAESNPSSAKKVAGFNFGTTRPFVYSIACDAGKYQGIYGMANAFMEKAGAYIGATEGSGRGANNNFSKKFFEKWINQTSKSLGLAWKELRIDCNDEWWSAEYQFFGDPKFGSIP
jgi:hypothetical protein